MSFEKETIAKLQDPEMGNVMGGVSSMKWWNNTIMGLVNRYYKGKLLFIHHWTR
ncbi:MAG: class I lanthipeptide [Salinivirgaceae bacterium]|nr:class I lanthipeptide [Salinivirgaceae bacterium]